jgi:hypothetical protein
MLSPPPIIVVGTPKSAAALVEIIHLINEA